MIKLSYIQKHKHKFYSVLGISQALKTSKSSVVRWCLSGELKYTQGESNGHQGAYLIKGQWLIDYLDNLNKYPEVEGWKNLNQILSEYKLPNERK